jgi:O-antigen/teichoic acid export membrane protein
MAFFAAERGRAAFVNDLVWTLVLLPTAVLALRRDPSSAPLLILVWGGSATVAAIVGVAQARTRPHLREGVHWFRDHRRLSMPLTVEAVAGVVLQQLASLGAAIVAGLAVVGAIRAAQLIVGPLLVLSQGLTLIAIPEGARLLRRSGALLWRACLVYAGATFAAYVLWGAAASRIPTDLGVALLHSNWFVAQPVVLPVALAIGAGVTGAALATGLRVLAEARRVLIGGLTSSVLSGAGTVVGAGVGGAVGAALFAALGNLVGVAVILRQLWTAMRHYELPREAGMMPRTTEVEPPRTTP